MASYRIPAVENFDFAKPEEWPRWIRHFERFRQASGLASKTEDVQVSTLIYSMGDKAEDLLESFNLKEDEAKEYKIVKTKFEEYFDKRRNTMRERNLTCANRRTMRRQWKSSSQICTDWPSTVATGPYRTS